MGPEAIIVNLSNVHQVKEKVMAMHGKSFKLHANNHIIMATSCLL